MEKMLLLVVSIILLISCNQSSSKSSNPDNNERITYSGITDFVSLDKAYIPVLFFTSVENLDASRASYKVLIKEWDSFQSVSTKIFTDEEWEKEQDKIDQHIIAARKFIEAGHDLKEAHEELEHVREILMEVRQRHDIDYFVDYLTAFHEPMEQIVLTAKETPPQQWTTETTEKIQSVLPEAETLWQAVQKADFDPVKFGFNEQRHQKMKQFIAAETKALETLKTNLQNETTAPQLKKSSMGIKPNFAGLFKLFGNLEAFQKSEADK